MSSQPPKFGSAPPYTNYHPNMGIPVASNIGFICPIQPVYMPPHNAPIAFPFYPGAMPAQAYNLPIQIQAIQSFANENNFRQILAYFEKNQDNCSKQSVVYAMERLAELNMENKWLTNCDKTDLLSFEFFKAIICEKIPDFNQEDIGTVCRALVQLSIKEAYIYDDLEKKIYGHINSFKERDIVPICKAFSFSEKPSTRFLGILEVIVVNKYSGFILKELLTVALAFTAAKYEARLLLTRMAAEATPIPNTYDDNDITDLMFALAFSGSKDINFLREISKFDVQRIDRLSEFNLSKFASSLAMLQHRDVALFNRIGLVTKDRMFRFSPKELDSIFWAFETLKITPPDFSRDQEVTYLPPSQTDNKVTGSSSSNISQTALAKINNPSATTNNMASSSRTSLNQQLMEATTFAEFQRLCNTHIDNYDTSNIATTFECLVEFKVKRMNFGQNNMQVNKELLRKLFDRTKLQAKFFKAEEISKVLEGLYILNLNSHEIYKIMAEQAVQKTEVFKLDELATTMAAFAAADLPRVAPFSTFYYQVARIAEMKINALTNEELGNCYKDLLSLVSSFATIGIQMPFLFYLIADKILMKVPELDEESLCNLARSFATLGMYDKALFENITSCAKRKVDGYKGKSLADLAWSYAKLNIKDSELFKMISQGASNGTKKFDIMNRIELHWAFETMGMQPPTITG